MAEQRVDVEVVQVAGSEHAEALARAFLSAADCKCRQVAAMVGEGFEERRPAAVGGALFLDGVDDSKGHHTTMLARGAQGSTAFGAPGDAPGSECAANDDGASSGASGLRRARLRPARGDFSAGNRESTAPLASLSRSSSP